MFVDLHNGSEKLSYKNCHTKIETTRDRDEMILDLNFTVGVQVAISGEYLCLPFLLEWLSVVLENRERMKHSRDTDAGARGEREGHVSIFAPVIRLIRKRAIYSEESLSHRPSSAM